MERRQFIVQQSYELNFGEVEQIVFKKAPNKLSIQISLTKFFFPFDHKSKQTRICT